MAELLRIALRRALRKDGPQNIKQIQDNPSHVIIDQCDNPASRDPFYTLTWQLHPTEELGKLNLE